MGFLSSLGGAAGTALGQALFGQSGGGHSTQYYIDRENLQWKKNYEAQKEFAQNGIRWKVDDAKAAGLHPLAALGSSGAFFSPTASAGVSGDVSGGYDASWLGDMGQSIGRAVEAKMTREERAKAEAVNDEANQLKLENMRLQNESIKLDMASQLARDVSASQRAVRQTGLPPSMPSLRTRPDGSTLGSNMPGQGDASGSSLYKLEPPEVAVSHPQTPYAEAGSHPDLAWLRTANGGYAPVRGQFAAQQMEDDPFAITSWNIRNRFGSAFSDQRFAPPREYLPGGGRDPRWMYVYDNLSGEWTPYHTSEPRYKALMKAVGMW